MKLLKKISRDLFGKDAGSDSIKEHQAQFKSTITANSVNTSHGNEGSPAPSGMFDVIVVGVSYYQETLSKICGNKRADDASLFGTAIVPYDDNPHDPHAVPSNWWGDGRPS